ncbi:STAS domain-containing protein [Nocardia sp. NPDC050793]|uniref:STAS domain-containing protein n=1 Tax=Nocardia sp. NPDC050793 TaxID=3155159 RepID=UPI00340319A5
MSTKIVVRSGVGRTHHHMRDKRRPGGRSVAMRGNCVVMVVDGELDLAGLPELCAALDAIPERGCSAVVVDFRATRFVGIRAALALGEYKRQLAEQGIDLRLVSGHAEIDRVLDLVGVRALFCYYISLDEALGP